MISLFPSFYPDELLYSLLARYYVKTGYMALSYMIEELYVHKYTVPDIEFINEMKPEIVSRLTEEISMESLVEKHTMFPAYVRFLPLERRTKALRDLLQMNGNFNNQLALPKNQRGEKNVLRYCPLCAKEDREKYGETYWHRVHQINGMTVCPFHNCYLEKTSIVMKRDTAPGLFSAEVEIPMSGGVKRCNNERETELAKYIAEVFFLSVDMEATGTIGKYLHQKLNKDKYLSASGARTEIEKIYQDYCAYYGELALASKERLQKTFNGYRWNNYEVCQLAMFEGVSVDELVHIPTNDYKEDLYTRIAKEYGVEIQLVRTIGEAIERENSKLGKVSSKSGVRELAWKKMDEELLPEVTAIVERIYGQGNERPRRVSVAAVCRELGIPDKRMGKLPRCKAVILAKQETQEMYWKREIEWACKTIEREGKHVTWRRIRDLTNMKRNDYLKVKNNSSEKDSSEKRK